MLSAILVTIFVTMSSAWAVEPQVSADPSCAPGEATAQDSWSVAELPADLFHIQLRNGMTFDLSRSHPLPSEDLKPMTAEQKATFFARRKEFLTFIAKFLAFPRTMGAMSWISGKVKGCLRKSSTSAAEDLLLVQLGSEMKETSQLQRLGYDFIARILAVADVQIWRDAATFVAAKSSALVIPIGVTAGAAALNVGFFRMYGIQLDFGYDFETKSGFFTRQKLTQKMKDALLIFEVGLLVGVMRQYQIERNLPQEQTVAINLPFGLAYKTSENTVAAGVLAGVSALDIVAAGLMTVGQPGLAAAFLAAGRVTSFASIYRAESTQSPLVLAAEWRRFSNWLAKFVKGKRCEQELLSSSTPDVTFASESNSPE